MDGCVLLEVSHVLSCERRLERNCEAEGQDSIWVICSSGLLQRGQLENTLWPRRFITFPVAISPPISLDINLRTPKEAEERAK